MPPENFKTRLQKAVDTEMSKQSKETQDSRVFMNEAQAFVRNTLRPIIGEVKDTLAQYRELSVKVSDSGDGMHASIATIEAVISVTKGPIKHQLKYTFSDKTKKELLINQSQGEAPVSLEKLAMENIGTKAIEEATQKLVLNILKAK